MWSVKFISAADLKYTPLWEEVLEQLSQKVCIFISLIYRIKYFWLSIYEVSDIFISLNQCTGDIAQVFIAKGMCVISKTKLIQHHIIKWKFFQGLLTLKLMRKISFATQNKNRTVLFFIRTPCLRYYSLKMYMLLFQSKASSLEQSTWYWLEYFLVTS